MPSESVCYPAKLSHGHIMNLLDKDVDFIWMPCIRWERGEDETAGNHYNCPIVMSYPEALRLNIEELREEGNEFLCRSSRTTTRTCCPSASTSTL